MNATRELSAQEIDQVSGGIVFIPIIVAFGKGLGYRIAAGTIVATALDALDIGSFEI
jgi:hypothetical protein